MSKSKKLRSKKKTNHQQIKVILTIFLYKILLHNSQSKTKWKKSH